MKGPFDDIGKTVVIIGWYRRVGSFKFIRCVGNDVTVLAVFKQIDVIKIIADTESLLSINVQLLTDKFNPEGFGNLRRQKLHPDRSAIQGGGGPDDSGVDLLAVFFQKGQLLKILSKDGDHLGRIADVVSIERPRVAMVNCQPLSEIIICLIVLDIAETVIVGDFVLNTKIHFMLHQLIRYFPDNGFVQGLRIHDLIVLPIQDPCAAGKNQEVDGDLPLQNGPGRIEAAPRRNDPADSKLTELFQHKPVITGNCCVGSGQGAVKIGDNHPDVHIFKRSLFCGDND